MRPPSFTPEVNAYIANNYITTKASDIAAHLGLDKRQVQNRAAYLRRLGRIVKVPKYHKYTEADDAYIIEQWGSLPTQEIAENLGLTFWQVKGRADRLRYSLPKKVAPQFTPEEDAYILAHRQTRTYFELGYHLGVSERAARNHVVTLLRDAVVNDDKTTIAALVKDPDYVEPCKITDGYDTVPWHIRISTRDQGLTLDMEGRNQADLTLDHEV